MELMAKLASKSPPPERRSWDRSHGEYIAGRAALDGVDVVAVAMEDKWGNGRLRLLVTTELREKFDRQRYLLNMAVTNGALADVLREAPRMVNAWQALDKAAEQAGADRLPPTAWEVTLEDGSVAAIAKDYDSRLAKGRAVAVYTLDEIAHILSRYQALNVVKLTWPGATVVRVNKSIPDPLDSISEATGLDDPIDDLWTGA
jgi:hypothetical protein